MKHLLKTTPSLSGIFLFKQFNNAACHWNLIFQ